MSAEMDEYPSLRFQDIRKKPAPRTDTRTDGRICKQYILPPPHTHKQSLGGGGGGRYNDIFTSVDNRFIKQLPHQINMTFMCATASHTLWRP